MASASGSNAPLGRVRPIKPRGAIKAQFIDNLPKQFSALNFGIPSTQDIVKQGVLEVSDNRLYDIEKGRIAYHHGPLDTRLGTSTKPSLCQTCQLSYKDCPGHFGYVKLPLPVFHIGYIKYIQAILSNICKSCATVLLEAHDRRRFLSDLRRPNIDNLRRSQTIKKINDQCKKVKACPRCSAIQGQVRRLSVLKLVHDKFSTFEKSTSAKKMAPEAKIIFDRSLDEAKKFSPELEKHTKRARDDLHALKVLNLFRKLDKDDCELLGLNPAEGRPEMFLWQYIPAPPICIRPSVAQDNASNEDDITTKLSEIILYSGHIRASLQSGASIQNIMGQWEFLALQVGMYVNSDVPGLAQPGFGKPIRGFCQRLKGKQGRFRGNLSGKRVDFSGRTVISPDPNLAIDQVAVPQLVAMTLTYPERVNNYNIDKLRERVCNGVGVFPGAQSVLKESEGFKLNLKYGNRTLVAQNLKVGDVVERHLEDNDIVLFNRQPSLHKLSIMSHRVKVRPWRTFRFNECVCTPYNADFDGDEMNLHVPQTEEARTEADVLMGVKYNLVTPKNGEPIIAATQDFITAAYLLTSKDRFYDRKAFAYVCNHMLLGDTHADLPPPAILKPRMLWTGKQVFNVLMRPNKQCPVLVNLEAPNKTWPKKHRWLPDMDPSDAYLVVRNSEVMCGRMDKATVGGGKKNSVFYVILRDFGPHAAADAMNRLSRLCARQLGVRGFSIGVIDVFPVDALTQHKSNLVMTAYKQCDEIIQDFNERRLVKAPGCNMEQTLENKISGILSGVRQAAGNYCVATLSNNNAPLVMAKSGSKGSDINVAQMVACVGQQIIGGQRVPDGFHDRSLPHFHKNTPQPAAKGFVRNSFYTGLMPTEFLFHAISGREGLVDTAVKTAETGYMSRRLMKSLEDLATQYDNTVQTAGGSIVQFQYGADRLDPVNMEDAGKPVDFTRTWIHAASCVLSEMGNTDQSLLPREMMQICHDTLRGERAKYVRLHLVSKQCIEIDDETIATSDDPKILLAIDEHEGARGFLNSIQEYVRSRALLCAKARKLVGLDPCLPDQDKPLCDEFSRWEKEESEAAATAGRVFGAEAPSQDRPSRQTHVDRVAKTSAAVLGAFMKMCLSKYQQAAVEPGHAVGPTAAHSIGEPGTQMTLKTFHFAGVAGMSITQGVPRIKEIINASKFISTPVITCPLQNDRDIHAARVVKGRMEKTFISDIVRSVVDEWSATNAKVLIEIDFKALADLQLGIRLCDIADAIVDAKKLKLKVKAGDLAIDYNRGRIEVVVGSAWQDVTVAKRAAKIRAAAKEKGQSILGAMDESTDTQLRINFLKRMLPHVPIAGYPQATRAVIQTDSKDATNHVLVEGYGLKACMTTEGVIGTKTTTNSVTECLEVLGIEAARKSIVHEIQVVMGEMGIDPRHMELLADVMTYKGELLGITRFGMGKMRDSVLQLASFEKTPDHLFDAAANMKKDPIEGVSESIIMGQSMGLGTGAFHVVRPLGIREWQLKPKPTTFEDAWRKEVAARRQKQAAKSRFSSINHGTVNGSGAITV